MNPNTFTEFSSLDNINDTSKSHKVIKNLTTENIELVDFNDIDISVNKQNNDSYTLSDKDSQLFKKNLEKIFSDPISTSIFKDPVLALDNIIYERETIETYFSRYGDTAPSPITRQNIGTYLHRINLFKDLTNEFINIFPEFKKEIYDKDSTYDSNRRTIWRILNGSSINHIKLLGYTDFILMDEHSTCGCGNHDHETFINYLLKKCNNQEVIEHVFQNAIDLDKVDSNGWSIIHHICGSGNLTDLEKLMSIVNDSNINISFDFTQVDSNGDNLLHLACENNGNLGIIKFLIDKGLDVDQPNSEGKVPFKLLIESLINGNNPNNLALEYFIMNDKYVDYDVGNGWKPLHYLCKFIDDINIYHKLLDCGINMEDVTDDGRTPFSILSEKCKNIDVLKFFVDSIGVDIENTDNNGWRPIHYACRYGDYNVVNYFLTIGTIITSQISRYGDEDKSYTPADLIQLNRNIREDDLEMFIQIMFCMV